MLFTMHIFAHYFTDSSLLKPKFLAHFSIDVHDFHSCSAEFIYSHANSRIAAFFQICFHTVIFELYLKKGQKKPRWRRSANGAQKYCFSVRLLQDFYMFYNMFFIFFCTFFALYLVVSKLFTNFAGGNQIVHTYDAMGNWQMTTYYTRKMALVENHRDRTNDTLNQRTVPCTFWIPKQARPYITLNKNG